MDNIVITINRQYGSGGKKIGRLLSEKLNIPYFNRDIITIASENSGIDEAMFGKIDEKLVNFNIFKTKKVYTGDLKDPSSNDFTSDENLFNYQAKVIKDIAESRSGIIIGRCANFILKDYPNVVSVFVHADNDFLRSRALERVSMPDKDIDKFIEKTNKYRAEYYKYHTGQSWYDLRGYDLVLDSGKIGYEKCVDAIISYIEIKYGKDILG